MKTHDDLGLWAKMLSEENEFLATELAEFSGNWRGQLATRDRLIEQLTEALEVALNPAEWDDDPQGQGQAALDAYREWKEGQDGHQG